MGLEGRGRTGGSVAVATEIKKHAVHVFLFLAGRNPRKARFFPARSEKMRPNLYYWKIMALRFAIKAVYYRYGS
jgi:hypothetical protein